MEPKAHGLEPAKFLQIGQKSVPEIHEAIKVTQQLEKKADKLIKSMVSDVFFIK
jgi:hypothetical protein